MSCLGGELLYSEDDYIMSLKTPEQVRAVESALENLTKVDFRARDDRIDRNSYDGKVGDENFEYTWDWLQGVRELFLRASAENRYVLFTADQ